MNKIEIEALALETVKGIKTEEDLVIPPFLAGAKSRSHAATACICFSGNPPFVLAQTISDTSTCKEESYPF